MTLIVLSFRIDINILHVMGRHMIIIIIIIIRFGFVGFGFMAYQPF